MKIIEKWDNNPFVPLKRNIFYCVPYQKIELKFLEEIEKSLKFDEIKIPNFYKTGDFLRFAYEFEFDLNRIVDELKNHLRWLEKLPELRLSYEAKELLDRGIVFQLGRDKHFRPLVFIQMDKLDYFDRKKTKGNLSEKS